MKQLAIIIFLTCSFNFSFSQSSDTFVIEKLSMPKELMQQFSRRQYLNFQTDIIEKHSALPDSIIQLGENPFLEGIVNAYKDHRPFTISPDMIWLLISQGFSRHISYNSEKYRNRFVNFTDKMNLQVEARNYITLGDTNSKWERVFPQFISQMNLYMDSTITEVLTSDFSTTTETTRIASQITIMEAFKGYFSYEVDGRGCGIPKIIIEGTVEDWQKVQEKIKFISKYELEWWTIELLNITDEIINAKKGKFNSDFWMNMVKVRIGKEYGESDKITGWIIKFYPYLFDGKRADFKFLSDIQSLPSESVRIPFVFKDDSMGIKLNMIFRAGFIGLTQNNKDFTLKPEIGWLIYYKKEDKPDIER